MVELMVGARMVATLERVVERRVTAKEKWVMAVERLATVEERWVMAEERWVMVMEVMKVALPVGTTEVAVVKVASVAAKMVAVKE